MTAVFSVTPDGVVMVPTKASTAPAPAPASSLSSKPSASSSARVSQPTQTARPAMTMTMTTARPVATNTKTASSRPAVPAQTPPSPPLSLFGFADEKSMNYVRDKISKKLWNLLLPHQRECLAISIDMEGVTFIADDQGLGKTAEMFAILAYYREDMPALIVTEASVVPNIATECKRWLGMPDSMIQTILAAKDVEWKGAEPPRIVIMGYDRARLIGAKALLAKKFRIVVCDESHNIKSRDSATAKTMLPVLQQARRRLLLSGTPMNRPVDFYMQLFGLRQDIFYDFEAFAQRYCKPSKRFIKAQNRYVVTYTGADNLEEFNALLQQTVMVRRRKEQVLNLPRKTRTVVFLNRNSGDAATTTGDEDGPVVDDGGEIVDDGGSSSSAESKNGLGGWKRKRDPREIVDPDEEGPAAKRQKLEPEAAKRRKKEGKESSSKWGGGKETEQQVLQQLHIICPTKIPFVVGEMKKFLKAMKPDDKVIIFANHQEMQKAMVATVEEHELKHIVITGSTTPAKRAKLIDLFQDDAAGVRVAVLSLGACSTGITLNKANIVILTELVFSADTLLQAEDRAHRLGQKRPVSIRYLLLKDSVDERVWKTVRGKLENIAKAVDGLEKSDFRARRVRVDFEQSTAATTPSASS